MAALLDSGLFSIIDTDSSIGVGWKLNVYRRGTSTRLDTFPTEADALTLDNANANPVIVGSDGRLPPIWFNEDAKGVLTDENDVVKETIDPLGDFAFAAATFTPEDYGAAGDGVTNDTMAMQALAEAIVDADGGVIEFRAGATYMIGIQAQTAHPYYLNPELLLDFLNVAGPIIIRMNGATMKCVDGLKYGSFNPVTGLAHPTVFPFNDLSYVATPYLQMMNFEGCTGLIVVENGILDGNIENQIIGGGYDDAGTQLPASGMFFKNCTGRIYVRNMESHHHGLDGMIFDGPTATANAQLAGALFQEVNLHNNGRQGCSFVGGGNVRFWRCQFANIGRDIGSLTYSPPGAGVDLEAEAGKTIRNVWFDDCDFFGNTGVGLLTVGAVSDILVTNSRLHGETQWSVWGDKPYIRFENTLINGALVNLYPGTAADPASKVLFTDCILTNNAALAPNGTVYTPGNVIISGTDTHHIRSQVVHAQAGTGTNGSVNGGLYENCVIRATAGALNVFGRFTGIDTHFINDGGTVPTHPGGLTGTPYATGTAGINFAGDAETSFYVTSGGVAVKHPPTIAGSRLVAYAASIALDLGTGSNFHTTLTGDLTLANPTNAYTGQRGRYRLTQDATGSRLLTAVGTAWKFPGGIPTLTTTANAVDVITYVVHTSALIEARIEKAFA